MPARALLAVLVLYTHFFSRFQSRIGVFKQPVHLGLALPEASTSSRNLAMSPCRGKVSKLHKTAFTFHIVTIIVRVAPQSTCMAPRPWPW